MPLKIGLNLEAKSTTSAIKSAPANRKTKLFDNADSDNDEQQTSHEDGFVEVRSFDDTDQSHPESEQQNSGNKHKLTKSKPVLQSAVDLSTLRAQQKKGAEAEAFDPTIYDYDAAYDAIHAKSAAKKAAERADAAERRPKYMSNLLEAAEIRKRDQLRAQDKLLQRERDAEGDEFADKEKFVTGAYKEQQEEIKRMEEEERKREKTEAERRKKSGMAGFFRTVIDDEERRHRDAVEAAANPQKTSGLDSNEPEEKTAIQLAQELNEKGANILINEEGQVADKRQLLTAGLNLVSKPKSKTYSSGSRSNTPQSNAGQVPLGRESTKSAMRERQTRMIESQLEQAAKRAAAAETEELQRMERAAKSRKTENDVSSAKERYLQRKRDAAAAAAEATKKP